MSKVLIIGDAMLDCYYWGHTTRISPEAPVPIVRLDDISYVLGGAANVAANVVSLGCECVLIGARGKDEEGYILTGLLREVGVTDYLVAENTRSTTTKTRVVAGGQHILRIDNEDTVHLTNKSTQTVRSRLITILKDCHAVVISDYAKGVISDELAHAIVIAANLHDVPLFVDPKGSNWSKYSNAFCVTPNLKEFKEFYLTQYAARLETLQEVAAVAPMVAEGWGWEYLVITAGADGMLVAPRGDYHSSKVAKIVAARDVTVADVSGAGDTVIAAFASDAASIEEPMEIDMIRAAEYANAAAAVAVSKLGTVAVSYHEVEDT